ncbi:Chitinase 2 [Hypoxylon texense]
MASGDDDALASTSASAPASASASVSATPVPDKPQPAPAPAPAPAAKPRRRFAPQLVEESVKSSSSSKEQQPSHKRLALTPPDSTANSTRRPTRDVSVQVDDTEMPDAPPPPPPKPMRRFAPVPIETTFDSYRVSNRRNPIGPTAELTPDPSPTTPHPPSFLDDGKQRQRGKSEDSPKKPRRKFAPQLIETTRRSKKADQPGPATKPVDKTDITPGTNHIYAPKPKRKAATRPTIAGPPNASGESDGFLTPRRQQSMKPHPNTRRGTRQSYTPDLDTIMSSESEKSSEENDDTEEAPALNIGAPALLGGNTEQGDDDGASWTSRQYNSRDRRESCDEEFSGYLLAVAAREAHRQRELEAAMAAFPNGVRPEGVEHFLVRDNSEDDDPLGEQLRHGTSQLLRRKESDPSWAVKEMRAHAEKLAEEKQDKMSIDEDLDHMDIAPPPEDPLWTTSAFRTSVDETMRDAPSPLLTASSPALLARVDSHPRAPSPRVAQETGLRATPFGIPFGFRNIEPEDPQMRRMRLAASPPMLGNNLKFRMCPSPKQTRMEPSQRYCVGEKPEDQKRDVTENTGLWRGYCSAKARDAEEAARPGPNLLMTPQEQTFPHDPFSAAFTASMSISGVISGTQSPGATSPTRGNSQQKGLHMLSGLSGLDERLKKEMARKELEERIAAEFDDAFVTQVYNYISLGYPATARAFDEELSKISGIDLEELRKDDHMKVDKGFMLHMEMSIHKGNSMTDKGTPMTDSDSGEETRFRSPEEAERRGRRKPKPPRWIALKLYIREWARQHPSLNDAGHGEMAWGVRARRGSWAI